MVPNDLCPVVYDLELVFLLLQRAVAAIDIKPSTILRTLVLAIRRLSSSSRPNLSQLEAWCATCNRIPGVHPGDSKLGGKLNRLVVLAGDDVVAEVTETNIGDQLRIESIIHAHSQAVIRSLGGAAISPQAESSATCVAKHHFSG